MPHLVNVLLLSYSLPLLLSVIVIVMMSIPGADACSKEFLKYYPSEFEEDWVTNIGRYQDTMCSLIEKQPHKRRFGLWLDAMDAMEAESQQASASVITSATTSPMGTCGQVRQKAAENTEIFSRLEYQYVCPKEKHPLHGRVFNETIEPLVGFLRDPRPVCKGKKSPVTLESKNFIMFSNWHCLEKKNMKSPRLVIADLGSTTFMYSLSGPSQSFLYEKYKAFGYTNLQRFLAWEAKPYPKTQGYFDQVPVEVMPHYQFYNVKINGEQGGKYNPLTHIRGIAKPRDFVSLKLDVDNSNIEFALIDQIISDPATYSLIDEFFFEHHSTVREFKWAWKEQVRGSMADGYKFFRKMRELGIRAHSWI